MTAASDHPAPVKRRRLLVLLPLVLFLALAALFLFRLGSGDPSKLPSALIGRPVPDTPLPPIAGLTRDGAPVPGVANADFKGAVTLVGAINLPIIKFSVDWWNTLHQPASVMKLGGPSIHPTILVPLLWMAASFTLLFVTLHVAAMGNEILRRRVRTLMLMQAQSAPGSRE